MALEGLLKEAEKLGLEVVEKNIDETIKVTEKVKLKDKDGYLYFLCKNNLNNLNRRKTLPARFFRYNPYIKHNIENYLNINNIPIKLLSEESEITDAHKDLKFYCLIHKTDFYKSWNEVKNGAYCPECGAERYKESRKNDYEYIYNGFKDRGCTLLTKEYTNNIQKLEYICEKHKDKGIQTVTWASFISNKHNCQYCACESVIALQRKSNKQFLKEAEAVHGDKYTVLEPYKNSKEKIKVLCNDCKHTFLTTPHHFLEGHGCPHCNVSLGENAIELYLKNNNIHFIPQYRIKGCVGTKKKMPFDFAIFNNIECNKLLYLIEYQGKQHYNPVQFGKMSVEEAKEQFKTQQHNDNLKREFCKNNNIKLLEIPYWDFKNIENILNNYNK